MKDDRQIVLEAVRHNGRALGSAPKFQDDEEIVREAIKKDGCALAYASEVRYFRKTPTGPPDPQSPKPPPRAAEKKFPKP